MSANYRDGGDSETKSGTVLRLEVRNHPGVMSHVCGMFSRRAFNLDGIACVPMEDRARSIMILLVNEDERLEQLVRQLRKLEDVIQIDRAPQAQAVFAAIARCVVED